MNDQLMVLSILITLR